MRSLRDIALFSDTRVDVFPAWESAQGERVLHDEIFGTRLRVLKSLRDGYGMQDAGGRERPSSSSPSPPYPASCILVTSIQSLLQPVPTPETMAAGTREIRVGAS